MNISCKFLFVLQFARTSEAKLNNFIRIEPVLRLLEIPFDTNVARSIMNENQSTTTRLVYELFVALSKKQKKQLTGVAMETMRPQAPAKLDTMSSIMYKQVN
jgi:CH-like domain in sperm protein